jgi:phenylpropionate dioxygenase-like ring-hydroxylating dioxygenase large terminal subunit
MAEGNAQFNPVPYEVSDPELISSKRYYDEEFFRLEAERLWPHVWQMACRLEQIPNVGDWVEYSILGKSVIVVRAKDGVKAYHNACRHRGVQLAPAGHHGNCQTQGFICPFHGWRWDMEGKCTFVYGKHLFTQGLLDQAELALAPCRVELWGGCAFVNFDDDAPSLRDCMGPVAQRLEARQVDKLRSEWWYATVLPANWKIAMEAFMEGYHVMRTHPQLQEASPAMYNARYGQDTGGLGRAVNPKATLPELIDAEIRNMELLSSGMAGMCHAKDLETARGLRHVEPQADGDVHQQLMAWYGLVMAEITRQGRARGEATPDLIGVAQTDPVEAVEFTFPNYFLLPFFSSMASYRIRPLGPESCMFEIWSLTLFPEGQEPAPPMEPTVLPYDSKDFPQIPQQDYSNIPLQQIGLHAGHFDYMRLSKDREGLISNYHRLIDGYLKGAAPEKLAKAQHQLGGNFDGPIKDLGL